MGDLKDAILKDIEPDGLSPQETVKRSIVKSVVYRLLMLLSDFGVLYLFSREVNMSIGFAIVNNIWNMIAYFGYDRLWNEIKWGKVIRHRDPSEKRPRWPFMRHKPEKPEDIS